MVEYTKVKRLEHEFERVRLSQDDLKRIGLFLKNREEDIQSQLEIEIVSLDGEETITCSDPEIFSSDSLPKEIKSINFSLRNYPDTDIEMDFPEPGDVYQKYARLRVQSNNEMQASGIFREVGRAVEAHEIWGKGFRIFADSIIGYALFSVLCTMSVYSVFDVPLDLIYLWRPDLKDVLLPVVLIGWICMGIAFFGGGFFVNYILGKIIPPIEYTGELAGASSKTAKRLKWWFFILFLPIILSVISAFIKDYIQEIMNLLGKLF